MNLWSFTFAGTEMNPIKLTEQCGRILTWLQPNNEIYLLDWVVNLNYALKKREELRGDFHLQIKRFISIERYSNQNSVGLNPGWVNKRKNVAEMKHSTGVMC